MRTGRPFSARDEAVPLPQTFGSAPA